EKGKTSQMSRVFPTILPEDKGRETKQQTGNSQLWFFLLTLLADPKNKWIIAWTGEQRFFKVKNTDEVCRLWAEHNNRRENANWDTLQRTLRSCGTHLILMAVPSKTHRGRNEKGMYGYVIEPAHYIKMTREQLDEFIREHCE
ncbi:hypothetical protein PMAYCL1PPCAC_31151, partial [Pristionchus mayeri]